MTYKKKMKSFLRSYMLPNDYLNTFKINILDQRKSQFFFSKLDFWIFKVKLFMEFGKKWKSLILFLPKAAIAALRNFFNFFFAPPKNHFWRLLMAPKKIYGGPHFLWRKQKKKNFFFLRSIFWFLAQFNFTQYFAVVKPL